MSRSLDSTIVARLPLGMPTPNCLIVDNRDAVRILTLSRPEKRNALDTLLITALLAALDAADADDGVGAIVVAGAGQLFSAGAVLGEFRDAGPALEAMNNRRSDLLLDLQLRLGELDKPVIAAVHGAAIGAGAAIALAADMVVLASDAKIGYPETKHAMVPSLMVATLIRHAGRKAAFELLASGESIAAERAFALGLVNRLVAPDTVLAEAVRMATALAALDRATIAATKRVFNECADLPLADALRAGRAFGRRLRADRGNA